MTVDFIFEARRPKPRGSQRQGSQRTSSEMKSINSNQPAPTRHLIVRGLECTPMYSYVLLSTPKYSYVILCTPFPRSVLRSTQEYMGVHRSTWEYIWSTWEYLEYIGVHGSTSWEYIGVQKQNMESQRRQRTVGDDTIPYHMYYYHWSTHGALTKHHLFCCFVFHRHHHDLDISGLPLPLIPTTSS